jgi:hypothetical protein
MTQIEISRKLAKDAGLEAQKADAIVQAVGVAVVLSTLGTVIGTAGAAVNFLAAHYRP